MHMYVSQALGLHTYACHLQRHVAEASEHAFTGTQTPFIAQPHADLRRQITDMLDLHRFRSGCKHSFLRADIGRFVLWSSEAQPYLLASFLILA